VYQATTRTGMLLASDKKNITAEGIAWQADPVAKLLGPCI
jgi:hypothetical protein